MISLSPREISMKNTIRALLIGATAIALVGCSAFVKVRPARAEGLPPAVCTQEVVDAAKIKHDAQVKADKTKADAVAAEKLKAEQVAADKAKADKAKADQAAADKAKADQVAADKAKADKLQADQMAIDRAKANKAADEKK